MSKSKKKQVARAREQAAAANATAALAPAALDARLAAEGLDDVDASDAADPTGELDDDEAPADPAATRPLDAQAAGAGVDEALFERLVELVHALGEDRDEGEQVAWVWNGPAMAIKYVEAEGDLPRRMMVSAFRRGVVFQVEGDRQLVRQGDDWEAGLPAVTPPDVDA